MRQSALLVAVAALLACHTEDVVALQSGADAAQQEDAGCATPCGGQCCGAHQTCVEGSCCTPGCTGRQCGSDGCGGVCGECTGIWTCDEATGQCTCRPEDGETLCAAQHAECGPLSVVDRCGEEREVVCGGCTFPWTCDLVSNRCVCQAESEAELCDAHGIECGEARVTDACGQERSIAECGPCPEPEECEEGRCVPPCEPESDASFCERHGVECGEATGTDRCGEPRTVSECGPCLFPEECGPDSKCGGPFPPQNGSCYSPEDLVFGTDETASTTGNTTLASAVHSGSCGGTGPEVVYRFTLVHHREVVITVLPWSFRPTVYVRTNCPAADSQLPNACSYTTEVGPVTLTLPIVPPGTYYIWVDGFSGSKGAFALSVELNEAPELPDHDECGGALPLAFGPDGIARQKDATTDALNQYTGTCAAMNGPDLVYSFEVQVDAIARLTATRTDGQHRPAVYIRQDCASALPADELACGTPVAGVAVATTALPLAAGTYYAIVDGLDGGSGPFELELALMPVAPNDSCAHPQTLAFDAQGISTIAGDTRSASDRYSGTCGTMNGGDLVYTFFVESPSIARATLTRSSDDYYPALYIRRDCTSAEEADELACAVHSDGVAVVRTEPLARGSYFLFVDGVSRRSGPFELKLELRPVAAHDSCSQPLALELGPDGTAAVSGDTAFATNRYSGTCGTPMTGPDLVYTFTTSDRQTFVASVTRAPDDTLYTPALYLRSSCEANEDLACAVHAAGVATIGVHDLAAGTYYLIVDGTLARFGPFTLTAKLLPSFENTCADPQPLAIDPLTGTATVFGTTAPRANKAMGMCSSAGRDAAYTFLLEEERDVTITVTPDVATPVRHSVYVRSWCDDHTSEVGCFASPSNGVPAVLKLNRLPPRHLVRVG